jgi:hypothetical protein
MAELRSAASAAGEESGAVVTGGVGFGYDVVGELERVRANLVALAQVVEALRARLNAHTHGGAVGPPPAEEQATTAYTLH